MRTIPQQVGFAIELATLLHDVLPFQARFGNHVIDYPVVRDLDANKSLRDSVPCLLNVPPLSKSDEQYLASISSSSSSYSSEPAETKRQTADCSAAEEDKGYPREALHLYEQLVFLQERIDEARSYPSFQADSYANEAAHEYIKAHYKASGYLLPARLNLRAAMLHLGKKTELASRNFRASAGHFFDAGAYYSSAALMSELAAMTLESDILEFGRIVYTDPTVIGAHKDRSAAAKYWYDSLRFNHEQDSNHFIQGLKLFRGIANGLMWDECVADPYVDKMLIWAMAWHAENGMQLDTANDHIYLMLRKATQEELFDRRMWAHMKKVINYAALVWSLDGGVGYDGDKAEELADKAKKFANIQ